MYKKIGATTQICGVGVSSSSQDSLLESLEQILVSRRELELVLVTTPNPEQVVQAAADDMFCDILNQSSVALPDGVGLVWAAKLLSGVRLARIPGVEMAGKLIKLAWENDLGVAIVGGVDGVARRALENQKLRIKNPSYAEASAGKQNNNLNCKGLAISGVADIAHETREERKKALDEIKAFRPELLLVAYGAPRQEKWIWENREVLEKAGVKVAMVVGGAVDVWAGKVKRAPVVVRKAGLEWLWRLLRQPWRLRRQLRLIKFVWMVTRQTSARKES